MNYAKILKILIVGEKESGKSSILNRYAGEKFNKNILPTIAIDFKCIKYQDYNVQIWDVSGDPKFETTVRSFFLDIDCVIIVFDVNSLNYLDGVNKWIDKLNLKNGTIPFFIVGNKCDELIENTNMNNAINTLAQFYAEINNKYIVIENYIKVSAKNNLGIEKLFNNALNIGIAKKKTQDYNNIREIKVGRCNEDIGDKDSKKTKNRQKTCCLFC